MSDIDPRIVEALVKSGRVPMPTTDEILSGHSQGGIPRPAFLTNHEDDGTVEKATRQ